MDDALDDESFRFLMKAVMAASEDDERIMHLHTIKVLILAEREACAKIADEWNRTAFGLSAGAVKNAAASIAEAIRSREAA